METFERVTQAGIGSKNLFVSLFPRWLSAKISEREFPIAIPYFFLADPKPGPWCKHPNLETMPNLKVVTDSFSEIRFFAKKADAFLFSCQISIIA